MSIGASVLTRESKQTQCARPRVTRGTSLWIFLSFAPLSLLPQTSLKVLKFLLFGGFELLDLEIYLLAFSDEQF